MMARRTQRTAIIAFDASCLLTPHKAGVAKYTEQLVLSLAAAQPTVRFIGHYANFFGRIRPELPQAPNITYRPSRFMHPKLLNLLRRLGVWIPFEFLIRGRADFHLFPAFIGWPSLFRTPSAPVIHDLAYLDTPDTVSVRNRRDLTRFVPKELRRSSFIICVSETTADVLRAAFPFTRQKTCVVTGIPPTKLPTAGTAKHTAIRNKFGIHKPYILFVGTIEPRKNIPVLLDAYMALPAKLLEQYQLVLAGAVGWNSAELMQRIDDAKRHTDSLRITGYISDEEKNALYSEASVYVQPSRYEGFGMPVLEAMSFGLPVIASDIAILREVANNAALFTPVADAAALTRTLAKVAANPTLQRTLSMRSRAVAARYPSWHTIAHGVYQSIQTSRGETDL